MKDIRPLLIFPAVDHWNSSGLSPLFHDLIQLKLKGYGAQYPAGVLPIDTTDFYAFHLVIGWEAGGRFQPLMSGKTTTLSRTDFHHHAFPGLSLVEQARSPRHVSLMKTEIERCRLQKRELGYFGSWTVDPEVRENPALRAYLRDVFPGLYVHFHLQIGVEEIVLGGTPRFRTERLFARLGHQPLGAETEAELPQIQVRHLFGEPVQVMHLRQFSVEAFHEAQKTDELWSRCEFLGRPGSVIRAA